MVFITAQVLSGLIGTDAFQETDVTGITLPITKHNYLVTRADEIAETLREAFYIARSGRPGPVLVDICKNAQVESCEFVYPEEVKLPGYQPVTRSPKALLDEAVALIEKAHKPVILCGHGVLMSKAEEALMQFAVKTQTPVASTLLGLGAFPASHPLSLGMMGMHGEAYANNAIQNSDLILAFGMRFDDRVTGTLKTYAPKAKKIHIEIDPSEAEPFKIHDFSPEMGEKTAKLTVLPLPDCDFEDGIIPLVFLYLIRIKRSKFHRSCLSIFVCPGTGVFEFEPLPHRDLHRRGPGGRRLRDTGQCKHHRHHRRGRRHHRAHRRAPQRVRQRRRHHLRTPR